VQPLLERQDGLVTGGRGGGERGELDLADAGVPAAGRYLSLPGLRVMNAGVKLFPADRLPATVLLADGSSGFLWSGKLTASGLGEQAEPGARGGAGRGGCEHSGRS
jgi:hypothetical protein